MDELKDHALLVAARDVQRHSQNLVVYSRLVKAIVEVSWVFKLDGQPLKATGLKEWLRLRGLFLECLCPLVLDIRPREPRSCRLVESSSSGDVFAFCFLEHDGCGMQLNISNIVETTKLFSEYAHFPTLKGGAPSDIAAMGTILARYHDSGHPNMSVAPHLLGYIGEHISFYEPRAKQLAGMPRYLGGKGTTSRYTPHASTSFRIDEPLASAPTKGKRQYVEIDEFDNPSSNLPSTNEVAAFGGMPFVGMSRAHTRVRRARISGPVIATPAIAAPVVAAPVVAAPVIAAPVIAAPIITVPAVAAPIVAAPVVAAPVVAAPVVAAPVVAAPVIAAPIVAAPVVNTPAAAPATTLAANTAPATPAFVVAATPLIAGPPVAAAVTSVVASAPPPIQLGSPIEISSNSDSDSDGDSAESGSSTESIDSEAEDFTFNMLSRLVRGEGINAREWYDLALSCENCGMFFLSKDIKEHTVKCVEDDAI